MPSSPEPAASAAPRPSSPWPTTSGSAAVSGSDRRRRRRECPARRGRLFVEDDPEAVARSGLGADLCVHPNRAIGVPTAPGRRPAQASSNVPFACQNGAELSDIEHHPDDEEARQDQADSRRAQRPSRPRKRTVSGSNPGGTVLRALRCCDVAGWACCCRGVLGWGAGLGHTRRRTVGQRPRPLTTCI